MGGQAHGDEMGTRRGAKVSREIQRAMVDWEIQGEGFYVGYVSTELPVPGDHVRMTGRPFGTSDFTARVLHRTFKAPESTSPSVTITVARIDDEEATSVG